MLTQWEDHVAIDGVWIPILAITSFPVILIGYPIARAFAKRVEQQDRSPAIPPDVTARLERMEQAIDSIAVEVERISEGQRFTTKLLSDRSSGTALDAPRPAGPNQ
jgi:hypothetical protein